MSERSFRRDYQRRLSSAKRRHQLKARKTAAAAVAVGAFALAAPASSSAASLVVGSNADTTGATDCLDSTNTDCTLRQAIADATGNTESDTITFASSVTGTITLTSALVFNESNSSYSTTITGPGSDVLAISGEGAYNVFDIETTGSSPGLTISGLTLTDGSGTFAGAMDTRPYSNVYLDHVVVSNSTATGDSTSSADLDGGGITNRGQMTITNSTISGNASTYPGSGSPPPFLYGGGGIDNVGQLTVDNSAVTNNTAYFIGGGIFQGNSDYASSLNVSNSTITGNSANYAGGGIAEFNQPKYASSHNSIVNTTISGNDAFYGGGFSGKYIGGRDNWIISHSTLSGNDSAYGGGAVIGNVPGSFELLDSTISGNYANVGGGMGISGAAAKYQDAVQLNNSTIASNHAYGSGGGIHLGGYYGSNPAPNDIPVLSTIAADNTNYGVAGQDLDVPDSATYPVGFNLSFSLVEHPGDAPITQTPPGSNIFGVDPQLGALADNGGPTQTQMPAITSPVVDQGSAPGNLTTDQRGDPRTVDTSPANASNGTDIGSVERSTGPPVPPPPPPPPSGGGTKVHGIKKKHKKRKHVLRTTKKSLKIHVSFSSADPSVTFRCSVDGKPAAPCTSPFSPRVSSAPGKGKIHTVTITTVDSAGNVVGKPRTIRFRIIQVT
ncbi:MAG: hypothetical protein QOD14_1828 [Solirubrobacterales bacterium]|nr:hypothetical protein [Solirubrobacterales bacterium]